MPTYSYKCASCDFAFDQHQAFTDDSLTVCPHCGQPQLRKVFNAIGVTFKGTGFYHNDSRAKPGKHGHKTHGPDKAGPEKGSTEKGSTEKSGAEKASAASSSSSSSSTDSSGSSPKAKSDRPSAAKPVATSGSASSSK